MDVEVVKWVLVCLILHCTKIQIVNSQACTADTTRRIAVTGVRGINFETGRIAICDGKEWRAVCAAGWDMNDAMVACRELGFPTEGAQFCNNSCFGGNYTIRGAFNFRCSGDEKRLTGCGFDNLQNTTNGTNRFGWQTLRRCQGYVGLICIRPLAPPTQPPAAPPLTNNTMTTPPTSVTPISCDNADSNSFSSNSSGGVVLVVPGVVSIFLLLILVGVVTGWVWFCHRNRLKVKQQDSRTDSTAHNPAYNIPIPSFQYSSLGPRDTPTTSHTPGQEENVYHELGEVKTGEGQVGQQDTPTTSHTSGEKQGVNHEVEGQVAGPYEVPTRMDESTGRAAYSALHHN